MSGLGPLRKVNGTGLCPSCCSFRITSIFVFSAFGRALLGVVPHQNFQLHFSENVDFETPVKISEEGKERLRRKLSTELLSGIAMQ